MSGAKRKDYYRILGLPPSATAQEINTAYRALALKYHPDTSHTASDTVSDFRHLTEAYDVLSDPTKRREYDCRVRKTSSTPAPGNHAPNTETSDVSSEPFHCDLRVTPEEARFGATIPFTLTTQTRCGSCHRTGPLEGRICPACGGTGVLSRRQCISVVIPAGIRNGALLLLKAASDIVIHIRVQAYW
jgi:DnaJ-class molecular chaperone